MKIISSNIRKAVTSANSPTWQHLKEETDLEDMTPDQASSSSRQVEQELSQK